MNFGETAVDAVPSERDSAERVAATDPLLDSDILSELEGALGRPALSDMMALVPRSVAEELARIDSALAAGDLAAAGRAAHTLKGFAGNMGLARLARGAARLDRHLREFPRSAPYAAALAEKLAETARETLEALAQRA